MADDFWERGFGGSSRPGSVDDDFWSRGFGSSAPSVPEEEDGIWSTIKREAPAFTARIAPAVAGGWAGAKIGGAIGTAIGGPPGTAIGAGIGGLAGGFLGGAGGEAAGEYIEGRELDPTEIALGGAFSAIPAGPIGRAVSKPGLSFLKRAGLHALEGASQGVLEATARPTASALLKGEYDQIRLPTMGELSGGAVGGAVIGGALGGGLDFLSTGGRANPLATPPPVWRGPPPDEFNETLLRQMGAEAEAPQAPARWTGAAPDEFAQDQLQPVRSPGEVAVDQMGAAGYPNVWDDNDPFTTLPPVWQGPPPDEFMPPPVVPPTPPPPPPTAAPVEFAPTDLPGSIRTPAEVAADKLRLAGVPDVWNDGVQPVPERVPDVTDLPDDPLWAAAQAADPHNQAMDATLRQMAQTLRQAEPTKRVLVRGEGDRVEGENTVGVTSAKPELGLEHLKQRPGWIADQIDKDADNPIFLEAKAAARAKDPFGYLAQAEELTTRDSVDTGGEEGFDPEKLDAVPEPIPSVDTMPKAPEPEQAAPIVDPRRTKLAAELAAKHNLPADHPLIQEHVAQVYPDRRGDGTTRSEIDELVRRLTPDELRAQHPETWQLVYEDELTRLPNRRAYARMIEKHKGPVASIDLGGLGYVNDNLGGHKVGDSFLRAAADSMRAALVGEEGATITRFGDKSDEFALLARDEAQAHRIAQKAQELFAQAEFTGLRDGKPVRYSGGRIDYGVGQAESGPTSYEAGDAALEANREAAKLQGLRADTKGKRPPGLREITGPRDVTDHAPGTDKAQLDEGQAGAPQAEGDVGGVREAAAEGSDLPDSGAPPPAELVPEKGTIVPESGTEPTPPVEASPGGKLFDRDAATDRLKSRGRNLNDLGSAAAEGAGALRDVAIIGASYIEDFARNTGGKIPEFADFARTVGNKLANVVPDISKHIRRIYDEAVALFKSQASEAPSREASAAEKYATAPTFYSQLERVATDKKAPSFASGGDWLRYLANPNRQVKAAELKWTGLDDYLKERGTKKVTKDEIAQFLKENQVEVKEVTKGRPSEDAWIPEGEEGDPNSPDITKFGNYQVPGGKNYRELLLTLPENDPLADISAGREPRNPTGPLATLNRPASFRSRHYEEPNILAHVRFNERVDADGKRVLFLEEIQSDWGEEGRERGFGLDNNKEKQAVIEELKQYGMKPSDDYEAMEAAGVPTSLLDRLDITRNESDSIPSGPFVGDTGQWSSLAMKRMLRYAAENGFDRIAWTKGAQQADRYNLANQVEGIQVFGRVDAGTGERTRSVEIKLHDSGAPIELGVDKNGVVDNTSPQAGEMQGKRLSDVVGKEMADKIMATDRHTRFEGEGLKLGGEGMVGFYDEIVPQVANKLGKKFGAKVGETRIDAGGGEWTARSQAGDADLGTFASEADAWRAVDENVRQMEGAVSRREFDVSRSPVAVHSMDITPQMRTSVMEEGQPLFKSGKGEKSTLDLAAVQKLIPNRKVTQAEDGSFQFKVGNVGVRIVNGEVHVDPAAFKAGHPGADPSTAVGSYKRVGDLATIKLLAKEGGPETLLHETWHLVKDLGLLSAREEKVLAERYGKPDMTPAQLEEAIADAYGAWNPKEPHSVFGRIAEFFRRIYRSFKPDAESVFGTVREGKAFARGDKIAAESTTPKYAEEQPKYATAPPMGTKTSGTPPRVDEKVADLDDLKAKNPKLKVPPLSRDKARPWESLDADIRKKVEDINGDEKKEVALYERARSGKINDVEVQVLDSLVKRKSYEYDEALTKLNEAEYSGKTDGPESIQYLRATVDKMVGDLALAARSDIEAGTKLARALAARARVMAPAAGDTPELILRHLMKQIPGLSNKAAGELLNIVKTNPTDLQDALHMALTPKFADKLIEAWKAGLVSGVPTQGANVLGNMGEQIMRLGETALASQLDKFGGPKTRFSGEAKFELKGGFEGMGEGFTQLKKDLKNILTLAPEDIDINAPLERQVGAIGGKTGRFVRTPFRLLSAADKFFQAYGGRAELYKLAFREAGGDINKAKALIKDPPSDMLKEVEASKQSRTFRDPDTIAKALENLRSKNKLLHFVMPFIQTPAAILKTTLQRSPAGFVEAGKAYKIYKDAVKNGVTGSELAKIKGNAVDKMARPLLGTLLMGGFAAYAKAGGMTGSGPTDTKDKNELRNSGWQAYSFVVTGPDGKKRYIPFNRFEPVSGLLGFAADAAEANDAKSGNDLLAKGVGSVVQNLTSKTYLQGLADAAELLTDPMGAGSKYVTDLAASAVPNIVGKAAQAIDPVVRDTRPESSGFAGIPEEIRKKIQARLPGVTQALPARRSGTGETIERRGNAASRFLSPVQPSTEEPGMAYSQTLVDLDAVPSAPQKLIKMRGRPVRLSDAEYRLLQEADEKTTIKMQKLTATPAFTRLNDEAKRNVLRNNYERGRADARNKVLRMPEFRKRANEVLRPKV